MGRTVLRTPASVGTANLNEKYFNFTQFDGINSNKNFIGIDQLSFSSANNVYVDQNKELSTRPVIKEKTISVITSGDVINILKVGTMTFYIVLDMQIVTVHFKYKDNWYNKTISTNGKTDVKIVTIGTKHYFFTQDTIVALEFSNDTSDIIWYSFNELVYVPTTKIVSSVSIEDAAQSKNILTTSTAVEYIFGKISPDVVELKNIIGTDVTVDIDGQLFDITFVLNNEKVFTTSINNILDLQIDTIKCAKSAQSYIAYKKRDNGNVMYYSVDGILFRTINYPRDHTSLHQEIVISDDGSAIYLFQYHLGTTYSNRVVANFYGISIANIEAGWTEYNATYNFTACNSYMNTSGTSTKVTNVSLLQPSLTELFTSSSSFEEGKVCFLIPFTVEFTTYNNTSTSYSETGDSATATRIFLGIISLINNTTSFVIHFDEFSNYYNRFPTCSAMVISAAEEVYVGTMLSYTGTQYYNYPVITMGLIYFQNNVPMIQSYNTSDSYIPGNLNIVKMSYFMTYYPQYIDAFLYQNCNTDMILRFEGDILYFDVLTRLGNMMLSSASLQDGKLSYSFSESSYLSASLYTQQYVYGQNTTNDFNRSRSRLQFNNHDYNKQLYDNISSNIIPSYKLSKNTNNFLTDRYFYYEGEQILLIRRTTQISTADGYLLPLFLSDDGQIFTNYALTNGNLYKNEYSSANIKVITTGVNSPIFPSFSQLISTNDVTLTINNLLYQSREFDGKLYIPEDTKVQFTSDITALVPFSQTSVGVFLEENVYEYRYDSTSEYFYLTPTKLQLGNEKGADVKLLYNSQILVSNIKGVTALTYQDFVQSTEQVFNYLTEAILTEYFAWKNGPIKIHQYKDWVFIYIENNPIIYIIDIRNSSWWKWTLPYPIRSLITSEQELMFLCIVRNRSVICTFDFDDNSVLDFGTNIFNWHIQSQRLHFEAPNFYKNVRQLNIITENSSNTIRYKLKFKNYHNVYNTENKDTVEYNIEQLSTLLKKVNFMKTNAFQFSIENDRTDPNPKAFKLSDITIKYRVTERIR